MSDDKETDSIINDTDTFEYYKNLEKTNKTRAGSRKKSVPARKPGKAKIQNRQPILEKMSVNANGKDSDADIETNDTIQSIQCSPMDILNESTTDTNRTPADMVTVDNEKSYRDVLRKAIRFTNHLRSGKQEYQKLGTSLDHVDVSHMRRRHTVQDSVREEQALEEFGQYIEVHGDRIDNINGRDNVASNADKSTGQRSEISDGRRIDMDERRSGTIDDEDTNMGIFVDDGDVFDGIFDEERNIELREQSLLHQHGGAPNRSLSYRRRGKNLHNGADNDEDASFGSHSVNNEESEDKEDDMNDDAVFLHQLLHDDVFTESDRQEYDNGDVEVERIGNAVEYDFARKRTYSQVEGASGQQSSSSDFKTPAHNSNEYAHEDWISKRCKRDDYLAYMLDLVQGGQSTTNDTTRLAMSRLYDVNFLNSRKRMRRLSEKMRGIRRMFENKTDFDSNQIDDVIDVVERHLPDIYTQHSGMIRNNHTYPLRVQLETDLNNVYAMQAQPERVNSCVGYPIPMLSLLSSTSPDVVQSAVGNDGDFRTNFTDLQTDSNAAVSYSNSANNTQHSSSIRNYPSIEVNEDTSIHDRISVRESHALYYWRNIPISYALYGSDQSVIQEIMNVVGDRDVGESANDEHGQKHTHMSTQPVLHKKIGLPTNMNELRTFDERYGQAAQRRAIAERVRIQQRQLLEKTKSSDLATVQSNGQQQYDQSKETKETNRSDGIDDNRQVVNKDKRSHTEDDDNDEDNIDIVKTKEKKRRRTHLQSERLGRSDASVQTINDDEQYADDDEDEDADILNDMTLDADERERRLNEREEHRRADDRKRRDEVHRVLQDAKLRSAYESMIDNDVFWETVAAHETIDDASVADPYTLMPEHIESFLYEPYGTRRACRAGKMCRGMLDFAPEHRVVLMEFLDPRIETQYQRTGVLPKERSLCVLCIRFVTQRLLNRIRQQTHRYTRCVSPYAYHIDRPGSYSKEAMIANLPEATDGQCWPQRRYDPSEYEPCVKEIVYELKSGEQRAQVRGFRERGEGLLFR